MKIINKKIGFSFFAILMFAFFIVNSVDAVTCPGDDDEGYTNANWDKSTGVCIPTQTGLPDPGGEDPLAQVIINVMNWLLGIVGVIAIIAFTVSGIRYLTSAGNDAAVEAAKKSMMWSIVGVIVALMGYIIIQAVDLMLNASSTTF